MSTVAQITARQLNANLSTSPRSPKGKSASAQNATKHGLTCAYPVIRSEERTRFQTLIAKSEHEIRPVERNLFKARSELKANRHSYKLQKRTPVNFEQNKSKCIEIPDCRMREPKTTANNSSPHQWATPFLGQAKSPSAAMQISIQYNSIRSVFTMRTPPIVKNNFKGLCLVALLAAFSLNAQPPRGGGPRQLPDAPGREVVQRVCGATCHGPEIVMGRGVGKEQWLATVNSMVSRGAKISETEFPIVLDYLIANFPPRGAAPAGPRPGGGGLTAGADDNHVVDPVSSARGKTIYIAECITCHGVKARGTDNGADIVRSLLVLKDRYGSTVNPFLKKGHPMQSGRPSSGLDPEQVKDLAHFLHDKVGDTLRSGPYNKILNVLTGNVKEGAAYFNGAGGCAKCHSASGDFAKIGQKYDPPTLQSKFLFPRTVGFGRGGGGGGRGPAQKPVTVKVTTADGKTAGGVLDRLDDFYVSFRDADGEYKTIKRTKNVTVVKNDPYQAHIDMLDKYTDKNMHDIVAYLESLK